MTASSPQPSSPVQGCWGAIFKMHTGHRCFPSANCAIRNDIPQLRPSEMFPTRPRAVPSCSPTQQEPVMGTVSRYWVFLTWDSRLEWHRGAEKQKWWCRNKKSSTWVTQTYLEGFYWGFFSFFFFLHRHKCLKLKSKTSQSYFTLIQCRKHCS